MGLCRNVIKNAARLSYSNAETHGKGDVATIFIMHEEELGLEHWSSIVGMQVFTENLWCGGADFEYNVGSLETAL